MAMRTFARSTPAMAIRMEMLAWMTATTIPSVLPEIGVAASLANGTVIAALLLGVGTVTLAPLLTVRRLVRLDLPATLRVVE